MKTPSPSKDKTEASPWDLRAITQIIADRFYIAALTLIFSLLAADAYLLTTPKSYTSTGVLYVEQRNSKVVSIDDVTQDDLESTDMMKTVEQSLTTDDVLLQVIQENHLAQNPAFIPARARPYTDDELLKAFNQHLKVKVRRGTRLIDISVETASPELSRDLVNSVVKAYKTQNINQRAAIAVSANAFLHRQVDEMKDNLEKSELDLEDYLAANGAVSLEEKQNIVVDTLKDLNLKLDDARSLRMKLEEDVSEYRQCITPEQIHGLASVASDPNVVTAANRVSDQEQILAGLAQRYRSEHPKYKDALAQLNQLRVNLNATIYSSGAQVNTAYEAALGNEKKLQEALKAQEQLALQLDKIAIPYHLLSRSVEANQALYQALVTRLKETDITKVLDNIPLRVVSEPRVSTESSGPKAAIIFAIAACLGLFGGVGLCVFFNSLDPSMRSIEDAENTLDLPVLAAIPQGKSQKSIPMVAQPNSALAESFRSLRTVLELKEITDRQVILITSSSAGEGKTFISINTAISLAQQGYRTLLIDADLRNPSVGKRLYISSQRAGLSDLLAGKMKPGNVDLTSEIDRLHILTAGVTLANPSVLTAGNRMAELLEDPLLASFDRIIFDTAPVNPVSDALHLVKFATAVCLVVQAGRTSAGAAQRALMSLQGAHARDLGVILNRVSSVRYNPYGYKFSQTAPRRTDLYPLLTKLAIKP